jgi:hypothetical protein
MEKSPSWEANSCPSSQKISRLLWNLKVHYRVYKNPPLVCFLSQMNSAHVFPPHFSKIHSEFFLSIISRSSKYSHSFRLSDKNFVCICHLPVHAKCPTRLTLINVITLIVVPVLLTEHHDMRAIGRVEVWPHAFLTSELDGSAWSASHPGRFTPRERAPDTHWIGGWVGPRAGLDAAEKRKIPSPYRDSNLRSSSP